MSRPLARRMPRQCPCRPRFLRAGAVDHLLFQLREKTNVQYRVAFLTGKPYGYSAGCQVYWSQGLLYNPPWLRNRTPTEFPGIPAWRTISAPPPPTSPTSGAACPCATAAGRS